MADDTHTQDPQTAVRDSFFEGATRLFQGASVADALSAAQPQSRQPQAPDAPKPEPTKPSAPSAAQPAPPPKPTAVPGPPKPLGGADGAKPGNAPADSAAPLDQQGDDLVPPADAFDKGPNRPRTQQWRELHAQKDKVVAERDAALKQLETFKSQTNGVPKEVQDRLTQLEQLNADLQARLEIVDVEQSPKYQAQFKPLRDSAIAMAKAAVGPEKAAQIEELMKLPESGYRDDAISQILQELSPARQGRLNTAIAEYEKLGFQTQELKKNGREIYQQMKLEAEQNAKAHQEYRRSQLNSEFEAEIKDWASVGMTEEEVGFARNIFLDGKDVSSRDLARTAIWAVHGPKAAATAMKLQEENAALRAELARYRNAEPGVAGDAQTGQQDSNELPTNAGLLDAVLAAARRDGRNWT